MPQRRHDFEARLRFLTPEEGGRQTPVSTGYRGDFRYLDDPPGTLWMIWPNEFITEQGEVLPPEIKVSGTTWARMFIVVDHYRTSLHRTRVQVGTPFQVVEGSHVVAEGVVTKLVGLHDD